MNTSTVARTDHGDVCKIGTAFSTIVQESSVLFTKSIVLLPPSTDVSLLPYSACFSKSQQIRECHALPTFADG